jgi:hypothetical protein
MIAGSSELSAKTNSTSSRAEATSARIVSWK